jgi:Tfp pilus assembly protein PilF
MDAMKREQDCAKAVSLLREALAMNPQHEDSHYCLANCLATWARYPMQL